MCARAGWGRRKVQIKKKKKAPFYACIGEEDSLSDLTRHTHVKWTEAYLGEQTHGHTPLLGSNFGS